MPIEALGEAYMPFLNKSVCLTRVMVIMALRALTMPLGVDWWIKKFRVLIGFASFSNSGLVMNGGFSSV